MKTTLFLITIISFGALTLRPGFAGQSHPALEGRSSETRAKKTHVGPGTTKAHPGPKLPQPFHRNATRGGDGFIPGSPASGNAAFNRQPGARPGSMVNETQHQRPPNPNLNRNPNLAASVASEMPGERRLPLAGLSGTPSPNLVVAHRGPSPAILGGPPLSSARNTAVINGTGMRHKL
jgi:hypothetical protein